MINRRDPGRWRNKWWYSHPVDRREGRKAASGIIKGRPRAAAADRHRLFNGEPPNVEDFDQGDAVLGQASWRRSALSAPLSVSETRPAASEDVVVDGERRPFGRTRIDRDFSSTTTHSELEGSRQIRKRSSGELLESHTIVLLKSTHALSLRTGLWF